ncbi:hypothetical protein [Singulisphaera sp. PoT]|uniref:hypothetical protein n=1 Tax=Singulisphaera sp. PoT TaxID=3411797 RepID=UPI003BF5DA54
MNMKSLLKLLPVAFVVTIAMMWMSYKLGLPHGIDSALSGLIIGSLVARSYVRDRSELAT